MVAWKWNQKSFLNGCHELRVVFPAFHQSLSERISVRTFRKVWEVCVCVCFFCCVFKASRSKD